MTLPQCWRYRTRPQHKGQTSRLKRNAAVLEAETASLARRDGRMGMTLKLANNNRCLRRYRTGGASAACALLALVFPLASAHARVQENMAIAAPFEVGESPAGNYLAAYIAGGE